MSKRTPTLAVRIGQALHDALGVDCYVTTPDRAPTLGCTMTTIVNGVSTEKRVTVLELLPDGVRVGLSDVPEKPNASAARPRVSPQPVTAVPADRR